MILSLVLSQPVASCAMPVMKGMKVKTDSPVTRKARFDGYCLYLLFLRE